MNIEHYIDIAIEIFLMLSFLIGGFLGFKINYLFMLIPLASIVLTIIYYSTRNKKRMILVKRELEQQWGTERKERRNFASIELLFRASSVENTSDFTIDNITWKDLNMDAVFEKLDHTMSYAGQQHLYNILRKPVFDNKELEERDSIIRSFQKNKNAALDVQFALKRLGRECTEGFVSFLFREIKFTKGSLLLYRLLSYLVFVIPFTFVINAKTGLLITMALLMANATIYNKVKIKISEELLTFKCLGKLIKGAKEAVKAEITEDEKSRLNNLLKRISGIEKSISKIYNNYELVGSNIKSDTQVLFESINMIRLREPIIFYKTVNLLNAHKEILKELYLAVGKLDAYIAIASYRDSVEYYTTPEFTTSNDRVTFNCKDIYHPLIQNPVANSLEMENKGILLTGSNASGKSTFLRTIGVNAILAQALYMVHARSYESTFFKVLTSIGTTDSIIEGDSYFMAESKSLKRILDEIDNQLFVLCIIDEVFRGTNTAERISGAAAVLNHIINANCCTFVATHDLELTRIMEDNYCNYHFREKIVGDDVRFDYTLHMGVCTSRNAIKILKLLNYPSEIYENAFKIAQNYL